MPIEVRRQNVQWVAPANYERLILVTRGTYSTYTHRLTVIALKGTHPSELYGLVQGGEETDELAHIFYSLDVIAEANVLVRSMNPRLSVTYPHAGNRRYT
jgi:hypothetical protein